MDVIFPGDSYDLMIYLFVPVNSQWLVYKKNHNS